MSAPRRPASQMPAAALLACLLMLAAAVPLAARPTEPEPPEPPEPPERAQPATQPDEPTMREQVELSPLVTRLLDDPVTSEAERRELRLFHGKWEALDKDALTANQQARLALMQYRLREDVFEREDVDPMLRAEAALRRGEPDKALALIDPTTSAQAALLCARAIEQRGELADAVNALKPWRQKLQHETDTFTDAAELTAAARGMVMLARLEGRPSHEYQFAMNQLGRAYQQLDPLYWPARLAEAEILVGKDNAQQAMAALQEALMLNPSSSRGWHALGVFSSERFAFDRAEGALEELRKINETHLLGDLVEARTRLMQRDPQSAREVLAAAHERYPTQRRVIALQAAAAALAYDDQAMQAALDRHDELAPGSPNALHETGAYLSMARQYEASERMLRRAIERQPNWPAPHVELGLLLMQAGNDQAARDALTRATRLDPFNRRAANQLKLVEALLEYERIETEHFVIRFRPGIDRVLARDMAAHLEEKIYPDITGAFEHEPTRKTHIDLMPNATWFAVRITGMPDIWTIAAATGDVISLTPPREGPGQRGTFDWANVIRHEYVHTVTLSQTNNRLPHWFTEACAVSQELAGRDYDTHQLLAWAVHNDELFTVRDINWGFIRPESPRDRPLAYAQAAWMLQFITRSAGHDAIIELMHRYGNGEENVAAIEAVTGYEHDEFMRRFKRWARSEVQRWGLTPPPEDEHIRAMITGQSEPASMPELRALIDEHGAHPSLLRLLAQRAVAEADPETARQIVMRYATARPVDPWAHRQLARLALQTGHKREAIAALQELDRDAARSGEWAHQLAQLHREAGRLVPAADAIDRALRREPYNATYRELAATIALQRSRTGEALSQVDALTILEPERAQHFIRLAALHARLGNTDEARQAAEKARELNPNAPVDQFLD